jgi:hypothetical protein
MPFEGRSTKVVLLGTRAASCEQGVAEREIELAAL